MEISLAWTMWDLEGHRKAYSKGSFGPFHYEYRTDCFHLNLIQLWLPTENQHQARLCLGYLLASPLASVFTQSLTHAHTCASLHPLFCSTFSLILTPLGEGTPHLPHPFNC